MKTSKSLYENVVLPNQRTSYKEKLNPDWYIPTVDHFIYKGLSLTNLNEVVEDLELSQGIIPDSIYNYVNSQLNKVSTDNSLENIPKEVKQDDIITPIRNRYLGEFMAQPNHFNCTVSDTDIMMKINSRLKNKIMRIVSDKVLKYLEDSEAAQQEASEANIEELIKEEKRKYLEDEAITAKNFLKAILDSNRIDEINNQLFYYMFSNYMPIVYFKLKENYIGLEVVPPTEALRIRTNNNLFIEDDDAFVRRELVTISRVLEHAEDFDKDDLDEIKKMLDENSGLYSFTGSGIGISVARLESRLMKSEDFKRNTGYLYDLYSRNKDSTVPIAGRSGEVERYHVVWKTEIEIKILKYYDEFGEVQEMEVDKDYELLEEAGDISLTDLCKQEFWECYRYGNTLGGVYSKPKPIIIQRDEFNKFGSCKSLYNGLTSVLNDYKPITLARKISKLVALREILNIQIHREIAKFKGYLNLIPESILSDSEELTQVQRLTQMYKDNTLIFNDEEADANILQALRTLGNNAQGEYIVALYNMRDKIKQEAREAADMNPERFGDIDTRGGKAVTENAIQRIATGSIPMFVMFDLFLERVYQAIIDYAKLLYTDGFKLAYTNSEGKLIEVNLKYEDLLYKDIGVLVTKNYVEKYRLDKIRDAVLSASAQLGDFGIMGKAITSDNTKELEKYLRELQELRNAREDAARQSQEQIAQYTEQMRDKIRTEDREHETELEHIKGGYDLEKEYIKAEIALASLKASGTGDNKIISDAENVLNQLRERFQQDVEKRKLSQKDRELDIKEKQIKSQEKIAKMNKN